MIQMGKKELIPLGEITVRSDGNFTLLTSNRDSIAKSSSLASDLNPLQKKLLQRSNVHNLIFHRLRTVDCEGYSLLLPLGTGCTSSTHFRSKISATRKKNQCIDAQKQTVSDHWQQYIREEDTITGCCREVEDSDIEQ